jgi:SNF2 family DNA or RNA helicase
MDDDPVLATLLHDYFKHEIPAKVAFVVDKARQLVREGKKVVIWATFVENLLLLERLLREMNPLKIYGNVPAYNEDDDPNFENRERNIADFKSRDDRPLLIANPAACSESVSLHMVCHNAIYLERTFNCGQFLQSMDRIHRVGMPPNTHPYYHIPILQCAVEHVVDQTLRKRQQVLYRLLDDDMPVLGYDDDSFLLDREDDLEEVFRELLAEISSSANKRSAATDRRNRPCR